MSTQKYVLWNTEENNTDLSSNTPTENLLQIWFLIFRKLNSNY